MHFQEIDAPTPTIEQIAGEHAQIHAALDAASTAEDRLGAVKEWDDLRRRLDTWSSLVHLRFNQDTTNEEYRKAREYCDRLEPKITELDVKMKRRLLDTPARDELAPELGEQAFALWEVDVLTYDPVIEADKVRESELEAEYNELLASAKLEFRSETYNLEGIGKFLEDPDRDVRHESDRIRWQWFANNGEQLDRIYDDLVKLRTSMAEKLGCADFIELGYKRMTRIDYNRDDVERFRAQIRDVVVPLAVELRRSQAEQLGLAKGDLMAWDEAVHDPAGNPRPAGDHDWMLDRATEMFDAMGDELGGFFRMMNEAGLLDLKNRSGKAGGGFCTAFPSEGVPFIFANFKGTKGDVEVFTHEMGHAFQCYMSRNQKLADYLWPTYESCEIHSMGLEFLTWPHMENFFGDDAERFRRLHLTQSILFLPYGTAVDHFQHLVYARPDATPSERNEMWQEMERTYLPWRNYGDMEYPKRGGRWQLQRHIYLSPFYYIDYVLAQTCALQFWRRAEDDRPTAMRDYVTLCRRGGEAPFQQLAQSAGLVSPFADHCLSDVVAQAQASL